MIPEWLLQWLGPILGGLALLLIGWRRQENVDKERRRDERIEGLEASVAAINLAMARDLPSKEDVAQLTMRLDGLDKVLSQVRDMVIRLDERGKIHDRE